MRDASNNATTLQIAQNMPVKESVELILIFEEEESESVIVISQQNRLCHEEPH